MLHGQRDGWEISLGRILAAPREPVPTLPCDRRAMDTAKGTRATQVDMGSL